MHPAAQKLVNAQVEVNRAVFEANEEGMQTPHARNWYILDRIEEAITDLKAARKLTHRECYRRGKLKCEVCGTWHTPSEKKPNHDCWKEKGNQ